MNVPKCGKPAAHAILVSASEPDFRNLNRYFIHCDCEPRGHHAEVSRTEFLAARKDGAGYSRESIHPWNGTRRFMTLDKWLKKRRAKKSKPAPRRAEASMRRVEKALARAAKKSPPKRRAKKAPPPEPVDLVALSKSRLAEAREIPDSKLAAFDELLNELERVGVEFHELLCCYCGAWNLQHVGPDQDENGDSLYFWSCDKCKDGKIDGREPSRAALFDARGFVDQMFGDPDDPDIMRAAKFRGALP